jgi:hypothetical protein
MPANYVWRSIPKPPPPEGIICQGTYDLLRRWWEDERDEVGDIYLEEHDIPYLDGMRFACMVADMRGDLYRIVDAIKKLSQVEIAVVHAENVKPAGA